MAPRYLLPLVLVGLLTSVVDQAPAQRTTAPAARPTKPRVIREALTTLPPGSFYLVLESAYPFTVAGAYESADSAESFRASMAELAPRYEVSGPHRGTGVSTPWQIVSVSVRMRGRDGREQTLEYDARAVDAVFLTMPAVDKFAMPYYTRVYGPRYADSLRTTILGGVGGLPQPPCHRYSFMCWPRPF